MIYDSFFIEHGVYMYFPLERKKNSSTQWSKGNIFPIYLKKKHYFQYIFYYLKEIIIIFIYKLKKVLYIFHTNV